MGGKNTVSWLVKFSFLWLLSPNCCRADAIWTAYMNISFHVGNHMLSELGETGIFGRSSTLKRVSGIIVPPDGKSQNACHPNTSYSQAKGIQTWLALVERGGCTFTQKIKVAVEKGARGVIIYNFAGTGNQMFPMSHQAFEDFVVVMIGNLKGSEIFHLIRKGVHVTAMIEVGRKHIIWMNHYFVTFVIATTAVLAYFIFYQIHRVWVARVQNRRWQQFATHLRKAFAQLQLKVLKDGDKEITPNGDICVICFEVYKHNDTIRVLTCNHFFHKNCIDPWILDHGTCPMCKCDILKALGIQVDVEDGAESLHVLMSTELRGSLLPNDLGTSNELPPARRFTKVTHLNEQRRTWNDSQLNSEVEEGHPSS
ncbi:E3 ubiquitin-protein ligase RNF133 [Tenrec ecaudatus]|uniref:E3 ubiquitin-protein ligase RNF133 n=1 Tax=Tenrec ecaudatus TaxID=94439 RepID=UPI003F590792